MEYLRDPLVPPAGRAYFIGDAAPVRLWEWAAGILARAQLPPVQRHLSLTTALRLGGALEKLHRALPCLGEPWLTRFTAAQLGMDHFFRHTRAEADFGYAPIISSDEGMARCFPAPDRR